MGHLIIGTNSGGALAFAIESAVDDTFMDTVFSTIKHSAERQSTGTRVRMFFVGLHGISGSQLLSIAGQDNDATQPATALRVGVDKFLSGSGRDQVVGAGFVRESGLTPVEHGLVDSGGTAYYFSTRESPFWSEDFSGLFAWQ